MKKLLIFLFISMNFFVVNAQSDDQIESAEDKNPIESQEEITDDDKAESMKNPLFFSMTQRGDQHIKISLMVDFPIQPKNLSIGGSGSLGYAYYFTPGFFVGGDISFGFSATEGSNVFYFIPIMAVTGYQFSIGRFEIPLMLGIGGIVETYINRSYFGFGVKPEVGAFFRFNPDWSFGLLTGAWLMPQWYDDSTKNRLGVFMDVSLSVRFHF
ncbi:MAG: TP0733 family outer membrane beta-barrel protein [Treponemataceae bacterium]